jgi:hypothetical protein
LIGFFVTLGAALLGFTAGEMILTDKWIGHYVEEAFPAGHLVIPIALALLVIILGKVLSKKQNKVEKTIETENNPLHKY